MTDPVPIKHMPLSFSRLSTYEQCPSKFAHLYVHKSVQDKGSAATEYGTRVHEILEHYGRASAASDSTALEMTARIELGNDAEQKATLRKFAPLIDRIVSKPGQKFFEYQMAVNKALQPVDWFASDVWLRSIADVLVVDGETAYCLDHKTGKVKDNPTQLQLFAAMVMWHFPQVQTVKTAFIWLAYDQVTRSHYERRFLNALWHALQPRLEAVQAAVDKGQFVTKPGPLCRWCPAMHLCKDARK